MNGGYYNGDLVDVVLALGLLFVGGGFMALFLFGVGVLAKMGFGWALRKVGWA